MKTLRKRFVGIAAAGLVAALAFAGCTPGDSDDGSTSDQGSSGSGEPLPDDQQHLTYAINWGWAASDISKAPLEIGMNIAISQVMEPLVKIDADKTIQPHLATSWEWETPTTLVFQLRDDVTFSDGTPLTAADAKGSIERYIGAQAALAAVLAPIETVEATDDYTLTITTSAPTGTLVGVLSIVYIGKAEFSHAELSAQDDEYWSLPIGTGPFVITDYVPQDQFVFTRNDDYWGEPALLQTLTMKQIPDINQKITALSTDEVQIVGGVPYDQFAAVEALDNVTLEQADSLSYYFLWFMNDSPPLDDPDVRRAMWMALDLPTIVSSLYGDTRRPMDSFCPSAAFGCVAADGLPTYDQAGAQDLLTDAGYPDGITVDMIFSTANATDNALAQALISSWQEIGVTVEPRGLDAATWLNEFVALNWDMDLQGNQTVTGDADYTLNRLYSCAAERLGYCNPDLDAIMTQAQQSTDTDERLQLYQQVVDIMAQDTPAIPLFESNINAAYRNTVQGLELPANEFIDFSTVYLTD
ncbi:MAG: ABC transporter substrate-binding protein [Beutenbergiaceae bacterium]